MFFEKRIAGHADIETADAHVNTEKKEMSMIVMSNAVVEPCWCVLHQGKIANYVLLKQKL